MTKEKKKIKSIYYFMHKEDTEKYIVVFNYDHPWDDVAMVAVDGKVAEIRWGKVRDDDNRSYISKMMTAYFMYIPDAYREVEYNELTINPSIKEYVDELIQKFTL